MMRDSYTARTGTAVVGGYEPLATTYRKSGISQREEAPATSSSGGKFDHSCKITDPTTLPLI